MRTETDTGAQPARTDTRSASSAASPTSSAGAAEQVLAAYEGWMESFRATTRRARARFLGRQWREWQDDAAARMDLYPAAVARAVDTLRAARVDGAGARDRFAALIGGRPDAELAETFYNSVMRRVLAIVGVDPHTEFTAAGDGLHHSDAVQPLHRSFSGGLTGETVAALFRATELAGAFAALEADAEACARAARDQLGAEAAGVAGADMLPFLFYRNKAAYLVARVRLGGGEVRPLLVPLVNGPRGVRPDAVLTTADEVHVVFSFTRSYFHVDVEGPARKSTSSTGGCREIP